MILIRFIFALFILSNIANTSDLRVDDTSRIKAFTKMWEHLEDYRVWTAARLESLDVHNQWGRVDQDAIAELTKEAPKNELDFIKKTSTLPNNLFFSEYYFYQVKDRVIDYYLSESLVASLELLFQQNAQQKPCAKLAERLKRDFLSINRSIIVDLTSPNQTTRAMNNPQLFNLMSRMTQGGERNLSSSPSFFLELSPEEEKLLFGGANGSEDLFCAKMISKIFILLESAFPSQAGRVIEAGPLIDASTIDVSSLTMLQSIESAKKNSPAIHEKLLDRFLNMGKFKFTDVEKTLRGHIHAYLEKTYGDLVTIEPLTKPTFPKQTKPKAPKKPKGKSKRKRAKTKKPKAKKPNAKRSAPNAVKINKALTSEDKLNTTAPLPVEDSAVDTAKTEQLNDQTIEATSVDDIKENALLETEREEAAAIEDEELPKFNFEEWYADEVLSRIMPAYAQEENANEALGALDLTAREDITEFTFNKGAEAFYKAVVDGGTRPVVKSDFDNFLRAVGGGYDREARSGSNTGYWLPNLSDTRSRNPYLRFTAHMPHNGTESFPIKTLKYFIKRALDTCDIHRGVSN